MAKVSQGIHRQRQNASWQESWSAGAIDPEAVIHLLLLRVLWWRLHPLQVKLSDVQGRGTGHPSLFYAKDLLWVLIFCMRTFLTTKSLDLLEEWKNGKFAFFSQERANFCTFKKLFYSSKILVSGDDPISLLACFGNLNCSHNDRFFIILSDYVGFPRRQLSPVFKMLSFLDCLFVCFCIESAHTYF